VIDISIKIRNDLLSAIAIDTLVQNCRRFEHYYSGARHFGFGLRIVAPALILFEIILGHNALFLVCPDKRKCAPQQRKARPAHAPVYSCEKERSPFLKSISGSWATIYNEANAANISNHACLTLLTSNLVALSIRTPMSTARDINISANCASGSLATIADIAFR
jgi:hypothetical protein